MAGPNAPVNPVGRAGVTPQSWTTPGGGPGIPHAPPKVTVPVPGQKPRPSPVLPNAKAKRPVAKPKPRKPSDLEKWLAGDVDYQQQLAEFNKSSSDYQSQYNKQTGITARDYAETQRALDRQGQQDRMDQQNDFAGRGILHSGVFAKSLGDYNTDFNSRVKNLVTGKNDKLGDLGDQRNQFLAQLRLEMNAAKQDAIRRRAQKLGL